MAGFKSKQSILECAICWPIFTLNNLFYFFFLQYTKICGWRAIFKTNYLKNVAMKSYFKALSKNNCLLTKILQ